MLMDKKEIKSTEILDSTDGKIIENELYIRFKRPYKFEDEEYNGVDLSGLENLTANDMILAQKQFERKGGTSLLIEMNIEYCCILAGRACKQPVEFFKGLPMQEAEKVKNRVSSFLFSQD